MKKFLAYSLATLLAAITLPASADQETVHCDIWITNGTIIDGTGADRFRGDILIEDGYIIHVGEIGDRIVAATTTIDAKGRIVSPGFIDAHAHGEPLSEPSFHNFLAMGVTTICLGQDGSSPAYEDLYEWIDKAEEAEPGPNIAMFIGHGTLRAMAGIGHSPEPTPEQLDKAKNIIRNWMEAGTFGMTTGLEYLPGRHARQPELNALAKVVGDYKGLVMSHMRTEDKGEVTGAIAELLEQGREGNVPVHVSHLKVVFGKGAEEAEDVLQVLQSARDEGQTVTADVYPYIASFTGIGIVFPDWAKAPNVYTEVVAERREELAAYLRERVNFRNGPEATLFGTRPYAGKTLAQVARELDKPFEDVLIDDIGPNGASAAYFVMADDVLDRFIVAPHVMISSDGSPTMRHPRGYGSFARVIRNYVVEREMMTLEQAIYKMSGLTAETLRMTSDRASIRSHELAGAPRGFLKKDYAADILIFNPSDVRDTATFEEPHQLAEGFDWVIVNGQVVRENGIFNEARAGTVLRKLSD